MGELHSVQNNTENKIVSGISFLSAGKISRIKVKVGISIACNRTKWRCYNPQCPKSVYLVKKGAQKEPVTNHIPRP